ncbi:MAG: hypothetical protein GTN36_01105 [Candidatus Aenigmarchaeota archaeon]|nr:hypothetical protein [Candidatus Aenigmarchaeota archaeon]
MPKFRLCFGDHLPNEPGGGGPYSTLPQERLPPDIIFEGTLEKARKKSERVSREKYHGDFRRWIERDNLQVVLLSGPSCVGKGPLIATVDNFFPKMSYSSVPVIRSRESRPKGPRPDEKYLWENPKYFRTAIEIRQLQNTSRFLVADCRGLPQAIDSDEILGAENDIVLVEAYHKFGPELSKLNNLFYGDVKISSVFVSPVSEKEIEDFKSQSIKLDSKIYEIMLDKLNKRTIYQGKDSNNPKVAENNKRRAMSAYSELMSAHNYTHVLVNHDGEGHPNWNRRPNGEFIGKPIGDASGVVESFINILTAGNSLNSEHWNSNTIY